MQEKRCVDFYTNKCLVLTKEETKKICEEKRNTDDFMGEIRLVCKYLCEYEKIVQDNLQLDTCNLIKCAKYFTKAC